MLRPTARSLAYLACGPVAGVVGLAWSLVASVGVGLLAITHLGGPAFLGAASLTRSLADVERRRAGWVLGAPIPSPHLPVLPGSVRQRVRALVVQPATWRDFTWLVLLFPLGIAGGVVGIVLAAVDLGAVFAPLWAWAVPNPRAPFPMRPLMTTPTGRIALTALGLLCAPLVGRLLRTLSRLLARAAQAMLAPGAHPRLVQQAAHLAETRQRVVDAQAAELRRIERDLHDGAQARIVAVGMTLALAVRRIRAGGDGAADVELARRQLDGALAELRRLVRGIHPPILTDRGLHPALGALAADSPLTVELDGDPSARFPAAIESAAYFVVAEGLANAAKHSDATRCRISLSRDGDMARVAFTDDGRGGADPDGPGLDGLRRRVEALDGTLCITSPPGGPTVLQAEFPCES